MYARLPLQQAIKVFSVIWSLYPIRFDISSVRVRINSGVGFSLISIVKSAIQ